MAKRIRSIRERFKAKIEIDPITGCHNWTGCLSKKGYGMILYGSRTHGTRACIKASRLAYELEHGAIPAGLYVLHKCDNRRCVNSAHLYAGTQFQNMQDMRERGPQKINPRDVLSGRFLKRSAFPEAYARL